MSDFTYPDELPIVPLVKPPNATVTVPGSKSITNRALVLAALCSRNGPCILDGALQSEDTEVMIDGLRKLGFRIEANWQSASIAIFRTDAEDLIPTPEADLF